ncbi:MAG: hypothetical protein ACD_81C00193G0002 [uncultured bacterium]|nr:MAG: hypothetical protein ACD_81C00193G0002 [uncultured bacterium]
MERFTALDNTIAQCTQTFTKQNNTCRFFCNVNGVVHGNTYISSTKSGCVIDAVAKIANNSPAAFKRKNNAFLLLRINACKNSGCGCAMHKLCIIHLCNVCSRNDTAHRKANIKTNLFGKNVAVTRKDFYFYTKLMQIANSFGGSCFGRIEKNNKSKKRHIVFSVFCVHFFRQCNFARSNRKDAISFGTKLLITLMRSAHKIGRECTIRSTSFARSRDRENVFRSTLSDKNTLAIVFDNEAAALAFKIKGNLVNFCIGRNIKLFMLCDSSVERTANARMECRGDI